MPRPLLRRNEQEKMQAYDPLSLTKKPTQTMQQIDKMQMDRLLRHKRSPRYMEALRQLDAGGHVHNQSKVKEIIDAIREEFPEVEVMGILLGYVAVCYLGKPYEVHTLDLTQSIVEHYKAGQALPNGMEKARGIAMCGSYEFIEVYADCCCAISIDGTVSVIYG